MSTPNQENQIPSSLFLSLLFLSFIFTSKIKTLTRRFNLTPQTVTLFVPKIPPVRYAVELGVMCKKRGQEWKLA
jgi:hypothetical protein